jgi:hypothetical protein
MVTFKQDVTNTFKWEQPTMGDLKKFNFPEKSVYMSYKTPKALG